MSLYLDLLIKTLTGWPYLPWEAEYLRKNPDAKPAWQRGQLGVSRHEGRDWPVFAHTMIGVKRMEHLAWCCEQVIDRGIPGDFVETGAWRGGASILMAGCLKDAGEYDRLVFVCDSFEGLPEPDPERYPSDAGDTHHEVEYLSVDLATVRENFDRYGLLDPVIFVEGWFKDTLPKLDTEEIAVLRLDGDMYESTHDALVNLYHKVSLGGFVIIDDYHAVLGCRRAVRDFRREHGIEAELVPVDTCAVYWRKP